MENKSDGKDNMSTSSSKTYTFYGRQKKENEKKMPTIIDIQINFSVERSLKHLPFENKSCRDNSGIFRLKSFQGREFTHI